MTSQFRRFTCIPLSLLFLALFVSVIVSPLHAQSTSVLATSTFDTSADGWTTVGDAVSAPTPTYVSTGGNPGGYISAVDAGLSARWYWSAPSKFLGDVSTAYGRTLSFDLRQDQADRQNSYPDVILTGAGLTLIFDTPSNPGTTWTSYRVLLVETAGWKNRATNQPATLAEMQKVLGALDSLLIRGEYRSGTDMGDLDNVVLGGNPEYRIYLPLVFR